MQMLDLWSATFASHEQRVLAARAGTKREIVGWGARPDAGESPKGELLEVVVAVVGQDVEDGVAIGFAHLLLGASHVPGQLEQVDVVSRDGLFGSDVEQAGADPEAVRMRLLAQLAQPMGLMHDNVIMRTIVDLRKPQIEGLDRLAKREGTSRAELIRRAVADWLRREAPTSGDEAFGLWKHRDGDALAYEDEIRSEWTRP